MFKLLISRTAITLEGSPGQSETTRAVLALCVEGFRSGIAGAGETEAELAARLGTEMGRPSTLLQGVRAKIVAAAERKRPAADAASHGTLRFVHPGEDPWWDRKWQSAYELRTGDPKRAENPREVFVIEPLARDTFSPHLIRGLLYYVLWSSEATRSKTWPPFRRESLRLSTLGDFSALEYAELVDQLRALWGERRVALAPGREVPPPPRTTLRVVYGVSRTLWWSTLALALLLNVFGGKASSWAVIAAALAALAIFVSRVAHGRMQAELPRRKAVTPTQS